MGETKIQETPEVCCKIMEIGWAYRHYEKKNFKRNMYAHKEKLLKYFEIARDKEYGMFMTPYRYPENADIETCVINGDMYFDFDNENDFEQVRKDAISIMSFISIVFKIPEEYVSIYYSGSKGIHIVVPGSIMGIQPRDDLNEIFKYIAMKSVRYTEHKTMDIKIYDRKRLFRVPFTRHEKTGAYKIPLTMDELMNKKREDIIVTAASYKPDSSITLKDIFPKEHPTMPAAQVAWNRFVHEYEDYAKEKTLSKDKTSEKKLSFMPPCMQYLIDNGAEPGYRNTSAACLTSAYKSLGKSLNEVQSLMDEWNSSLSRPIPRQELAKTIESVYTSTKYYGCTMFSYVAKCSENCKIHIAKQNKMQKDKLSQKTLLRKNKLKELGML